MPPLHDGSFFFFNDTATTEIYTLSLHDALPICSTGSGLNGSVSSVISVIMPSVPCEPTKDRKSTRLNSSHSQISYAVFCLKKKNYFTARTSAFFLPQCLIDLRRCLTLLIRCDCC